MNALTKSALISFDASAMLDWASESYTLDSLTAGLDMRYPGAFGHSRRVGWMSGSTAKKLGLSREEVTRVRRAGTFHDVGKIEVAAEIINKPGPLTDEEYEAVRRHADLGANMIVRSGDEKLAEMVRHHHERYDGGGYPDGLAGEEIPVGSRIIAVADTFDAITSRRPYRPALAHGDALRLLEEEAGAHFDPEVVRAFRRRYSGLRGFFGLRR